MKLSTITKALLLGLTVGCVITAPGSAVPIYALVKFWREAQEWTPPLPPESDPQKVRRSLYRLQKNEYIEIRQVGKQKFKFELTKKGKGLLAKSNFLEFAINPYQAWDGQWRMFVFDIPEKYKSTRDALRDKLKRLSFFPFQKSVWIFPHECDKEMNYLCEFLHVQPYTLVFTGKIHNDQLLRKYFVREGILTKQDLKHR